MATSHRVQLLRKAMGADIYNAVGDPVAVPSPDPGTATNPADQHQAHTFNELERGVYRVSVTGAGCAAGPGCSSSAPDTSAAQRRRQLQRALHAMIATVTLLCAPFRLPCLPRCSHQRQRRRQQPG